MPVSGPDPQDPSSEPGARPIRAPWPLLLALVAVALEAVVLIVLGIAETVALDSARLAMGISTALFFVGYGAFLLFCARSMWRGETWARSIVVMGQLIQLGTAWSNRDANPTAAAVAAVVAVVALVGIFHPASLRALED